jgi:hypothetical protein
VRLLVVLLLALAAVVAGCLEDPGSFSAGVDEGEARRRR